MTEEDMEVGRVRSGKKIIDPTHYIQIIGKILSTRSTGTQTKYPDQVPRPGTWPPRGTLGILYIIAN